MSNESLPGGFELTPKFPAKLGKERKFEITLSYKYAGPAQRLTRFTLPFNKIGEVISKAKDTAAKFEKVIPSKYHREYKS